jgi:LEA14-like dessication related protein
MNTRLLSILVLLSVLAGCAFVPEHVEPPSVHVADISLIGATLFEQQYKLSLRIQNPNDFDLPIEALSYEVELNDQPFAKGVSKQGVTVPSFGSALLDVEGISTISDLLRQIGRLEKGEMKGLRYRLKGKLTLQGSLRKIPFDYRGEIGAGILSPPSPRGTPESAPDKHTF